MCVHVTSGMYCHHTCATVAGGYWREDVRVLCVRVCVQRRRGNTMTHFQTASCATWPTEEVIHNKHCSEPQNTVNVNSSDSELTAEKLPSSLSAVSWMPLAPFPQDRSLALVRTAGRRGMPSPSTASLKPDAAGFTGPPQQHGNSLRDLPMTAGALAAWDLSCWL